MGKRKRQFVVMSESAKKRMKAYWDKKRKEKSEVVATEPATASPSGLAPDDVVKQLTAASQRDKLYLCSRATTVDEVGIKQENEVYGPNSSYKSSIVKVEGSDIDIDEHGIEYGDYELHSSGHENLNINAPNSINKASLVKVETDFNEHRSKYNTTTSSPRSKRKNASFADKNSDSTDQWNDLQSMNISDNKDEFDSFGKYIASQLRQLPIGLALDAQVKIQDFLAEAVLKVQKNTDPGENFNLI